MNVDLQIRAILDQHANLAGPAVQISEIADLFSNGLDSQAVVNVMLAIEECFDFEFPEDRLNRETFATIEAITAVVDSRFELA